MRPKFEVGEVVLLRSVNFPECNGEATVLDIIEDRTFVYAYKLTISHHADGFLEYWGEPALRKKHTPGEMTFDNLMASLSSPKLITHQT